MEKRATAEQITSRIASKAGVRPLTFMEVCGTHTMAAARFGLRSILPPNIRLISGPGCPVCVTPVEYVDHALALAAFQEVTIATFGDMMRVPGSMPREDGEMPKNLIRARAEGADVRVVYSPLDALKIAKSNPLRQVVFLGVGFETTAPTLAAAIQRARVEAVENFSLLTATKTIPEAMASLAGAPDLKIDGFLCPGHVSAVIGSEVYRPLAERAGLACAIAGFEPLEILEGLAALVDQVIEERPVVANCYGSVVRAEGNPTAKDILYQVFEPCAGRWRGIGIIEGSGLAIRDRFIEFDAAKRFEVFLDDPREPEGCRCGDVLKGIIDPFECALFAEACTPAHPRGACMVSSEGSCAASYNYRLEEKRS
jgi:hydrogenase expression/formation protein HypD